MAADEPAHPVADRIRLGEDRTPFEQPANLLRELSGGHIPTIRLVAKRLEHDAIEIAVETAGEPGRGRSPRGARAGPSRPLLRRPQAPANGRAGSGDRVGGRRPVMSSYKTTPRTYTSVAVVTGSPLICSGAA